MAVLESPLTVCCSELIASINNLGFVLCPQLPTLNTHQSNEKYNKYNHRAILNNPAAVPICIHQ